MSLSSKFCAGTKKDKNPCTRKASVGLFCKIHSKVKPGADKENDEWVGRLGIFRTASGAFRHVTLKLTQTCFETLLMGLSACVLAAATMLICAAFTKQLRETSMFSLP